MLKFFYQFYKTFLSFSKIGILKIIFSLKKKKKRRKCTSASMLNNNWSTLVTFLIQIKYQVITFKIHIHLQIFLRSFNQNDRPYVLINQLLINGHEIINFFNQILKLKLIDFNGMSIHLGLFYDLKLEKCVYCLRVYAHSYTISNTNKLYTVVWFHVFASNMEIY